MSDSAESSEQEPQRQANGKGVEQRPFAEPSNIIDADTESDVGGRSRSRSASRRRRRQATKKKSQPMPPVKEMDPDEDRSDNENYQMQPFDRIGPPEKSMNGPITKARADRGEIPQRGGPNDGQKINTQEGQGHKDMMDSDGLKLRVELNLDIEIELKASIKGDLTIALL
ncbi:MAG: hypothetical protein M1827_005159 [Pycnora praestabilis]|nr:MAG: hypothetical protein M1827_005159 [Pycnora praestabilis]